MTSPPTPHSHAGTGGCAGVIIDLRRVGLIGVLLLAAIIASEGRS